MTSFISGRADAERAVQLAQDLKLALAMALIEQQDDAQVTDFQAWRDAGVPDALRTLQPFIDRTLQNLERTP